MRAYFKNVDFLRFLLCIGIILRHIHNYILYKPEFSHISIYDNIIENMFGFIPVDCFFIISGFFLFFTTDFSKNVYSFMKKKLIRLLPVAVFITALCSLTWSVFNHKIIINMNNFWALFMLQNVGITNEYTSSENIWFISVLFWVSCLLFYLYKIMDKKWFNLLMVCICFFSYSFYYNFGIDKEPVETYYIFNYGIMRGLAGMSFGYIIYQLYEDLFKQIKDKQETLSTKLIYTYAEGCLLFFVFMNILYKNIDYENPLLIVLTFAVLFILFILKKGYISKILDNNFSKFLGKYTYSIFVTHFLVVHVWIFYIYKYCPNLVLFYPEYNIPAVFITSIIAGIITYHCVEKPVAEFLTKQ